MTARVPEHRVNLCRNRGEILWVALETLPDLADVRERFLRVCFRGDRVTSPRAHPVGPRPRLVIDPSQRLSSDGSRIRVILAKLNEEIYQGTLDPLFRLSFLLGEQNPPETLRVLLAHSLLSGKGEAPSADTTVKSVLNQNVEGIKGVRLGEIREVVDVAHVDLLSVAPDKGRYRPPHHRGQAFSDLFLRLSVKAHEQRRYRGAVARYDGDDRDQVVDKRCANAFCTVLVSLGERGGRAPSLIDLVTK